jgi:hypothetical protein
MGTPPRQGTSSDEAMGAVRVTCEAAGCRHNGTRRPDMGHIRQCNLKHVTVNARGECRAYSPKQ